MRNLCLVVGGIFPRGKGEDGKVSQKAAQQLILHYDQCVISHGGNNQYLQYSTTECHEGKNV